MGEHEWCGEVEEDCCEPGLCLEGGSEGCFDFFHVVADEYVAEPGQSHDADGGGHAGAEGVLGGDEFGGLFGYDADEGCCGEHDCHDGRGGVDGGVGDESELF